MPCGTLLTQTLSPSLFASLALTFPSAPQIVCGFYDVETAWQPKALYGAQGSASFPLSSSSSSSSDDDEDGDHDHGFPDGDGAGADGKDGVKVDSAFTAEQDKVMIQLLTSMTYRVPPPLIDLPEEQASPTGPLDLEHFVLN